MTRRAQRSFAAFSWPQVRRLTAGGVCQLARSQAADQHEHKPEPEVTAKWHESGRTPVAIRGQTPSAVPTHTPCRYRCWKASTLSELSSPPRVAHTDRRYQEPVIASSCGLPTV